jgi:hypothetical protein
MIVVELFGVLAGYEGPHKGLFLLTRHGQVFMCWFVE